MLNLEAESGILKRLEIHSEFKCGPYSCRMVEPEKMGEMYKGYTYFFFSKHLGNYHVPGRELADWTQDEKSAFIHFREVTVQ